MKTIETKVYEYDELNDKAKEAARQWFYEGCFDYDWWDFIFDDAKTIGLKITSFDLDRNRHAKGAFVDSAISIARAIIENHDEPCATFKTAKNFLQEIDSLQIEYPENSEGERDSSYDDELDSIESEFLKSLLEDYSIILQEEADYKGSEEYLAENIRINGYTFTENGKRFG